MCGVTVGNHHSSLVTNIPGSPPKPELEAVGKTSTGQSVTSENTCRELVPAEYFKNNPPHEKSSLSQRIANRFKATGMTLKHGAQGGAILGGVIGAASGGVPGAFAGGVIGTAIGGLIKLAQIARGKDAGTLTTEKALVTGCCLGGVVGAVITGLPTAAAGALAGSVVGAAFAIPLSVYRLVSGSYDINQKESGLMDVISRQARMNLGTGIMFSDKNKMPVKAAMKEMNIELKDLDERTLKRKYHALSFKKHPDKRLDVDPEITEKEFQKLNEANEVLKKALKEDLYFSDALKLQISKAKAKAAAAA